MANTRNNQSIFVDTNDTTLSGDVFYICGIRYLGASSGTCVIKSGSSSGEIIFDAEGASNDYVDLGGLRIKDNIHVALTNSAEVIIYLK